MGDMFNEDFCRNLGAIDNSVSVLKRAAERLGDSGLKDTENQIADKKPLTVLGMQLTDP